MRKIERRTVTPSKPKKEKRRSPLKEWRERRALTQRQLAERAGVTQATVARIELGHHEPQAATVQKLADALRVKPSSLMDPP